MSELRHWWELFKLAPSPLKLIVVTCVAKTVSTIGAVTADLLA